MKCLYYSLSEVDILFILNSLSYYISEITWHDSIAQKEKISHYFNFKDDFDRQYGILNNIFKRLSSESNRRIYEIINNDYYIGQRQYMLHKKIDFIYDKNKYDEIIKKYLNENKHI